MDSGKLQPALYGGLVIGVLSALPIVNAGNCCCCLWVIAGGMLAVYLRQQNTPFAVTSADGALIGLLAGLIGGVVSGLLSIPLHALTAGFQQQMLERLMASNPDLPPEVRQGMERWATGAALQTVGALVNVVVFTVFGMLGGLLGAAVFKRHAPPPPQGTIEVLPPE
jgi:uncharacterized membrane protein YvlD (DUF360 family)